MRTSPGRAHIEGGCTAARHVPTLWSYRRHRCRCPETMAVVRRHWQRYYRNRARSRSNLAPPPSPVAIGLAVAGDPAACARPVERRAAAAILLARPGTTVAELARRLHVSTRTAQRYATRIRTEGSAGHGLAA